MEPVDNVKLEMDYPAPDTYRIRLMVQGELSTSKVVVWYDVATLAVQSSESAARTQAAVVLAELVDEAWGLEPPTP